MKQADLGMNLTTKRTRKRAFLGEMERVGDLCIGSLDGAAIEVAGDRLGWNSSLRTWAALLACCTLRYLSLRHQWNLPRVGKPDDAAQDETMR